MKISACIITRNEEHNLPRCLSSLQSLVDEIVIVDSGSEDTTPRIAREFKARFISHTWKGYVEQKNFAIYKATHPWILSLDADEEVSPALKESIITLREKDPTSLPSGYLVSRLVFYRCRWIYHGDWFPDLLVRLFQKKQAKFVGGLVHERLEIEGPTEPLPGYLHHYTYRNREDRCDRMENYARLWARSAHEKGKQAHSWSPLIHALIRFWKGFIQKRGFLDGIIGWEIAWGNACEVFLKYNYLLELNREERAK